MRTSQVLSIPLSLHALHNRQKRNCLALSAFTQSSDFSHHNHKEVQTVLLDECLTGYVSGCLHMSNRNWSISPTPNMDWPFIVNLIQITTMSTTMSCGFRFEVVVVSLINSANVKIRQNNWTWTTCGSLHDNWDKTWKSPHVHHNYQTSLVSTMSCNEQEWIALVCSSVTLSGLQALHSHPVWNPNIFKPLQPLNSETCFQLRRKASGFTIGNQDRGAHKLLSCLLQSLCYWLCGCITNLSAFCRQVKARGQTHPPLLTNPL